MTPLPTSTYMPFEGHRTCADWSAWQADIESVAARVPQEYEVHITGVRQPMSGYRVPNSRNTGAGAMMQTAKKLGL